MDELISLMDQHKFWRNGFRVNLDKDENHRRVDKNGRTWLKYPYAPRSNTIREGAILECVQRMLPHVNSVCLNKKAATSPPMQRHKDRKNEGNSFICFWGDYDNSNNQGALCLEDGRVFSDKLVFHGAYNGAEIKHWVLPHSQGFRYSAVIFNGPKVYPKGKPTSALD